jgi:hypothetical protein
MRTKIGATWACGAYRKPVNEGCIMYWDLREALGVPWFDREK